MNINKQLNAVFWLAIASVVTTILFKTSKIIFLLVVKDEWIDTPFERSVISIIVTSAALLIFKVWRYAPRVAHLNKARKNHEETQGAILAKMFRITRLLIIFYAFALSSDISAIAEVEGNSTTLMVIRFFPIVSTSILILITILLMIRIRHVSKILNIPLSKKAYEGTKDSKKENESTDTLEVTKRKNKDIVKTKDELKEWEEWMKKNGKKF